MRWIALAPLVLCGCHQPAPDEQANVVDDNLASIAEPSDSTGNKAPGTVFIDDGVDTRPPSPGVPPPK